MLPDINDISDWTQFFKESLQEDIYTTRSSRQRIAQLLPQAIKRLETTLHHEPDMDSKEGRAFAIAQGALTLKAIKDNTIPTPTLNFSSAQQAARVGESKARPVASPVTHDEIVMILREAEEERVEVDNFKQSQQDQPTTALVPMSTYEPILPDS